MHHIAHFTSMYWSAHFIFLVCVFASSRIDTGTEEYDEEFAYYPEEDIVGTTSVELTGEPLYPFYILLSLLI